MNSQILIYLFLLATLALHTVNGRSILKMKNEASSYIKFHKSQGIGANHVPIQHGNLNHNKDKHPDDDEKSHIIPLKFVANVPTHVGTFVPEKVGLLLHEYYEDVYKLHPIYKNRRDLEDAVLSKKDPFAEQNDPYNDDDSITRFVESLRVGAVERSANTVERSAEQDPMNNIENGSENSKGNNAALMQMPQLDVKRKFTLEKNEELEYTKTTIKPLYFQPFIPGKRRGEEDKVDDDQEIDM